ncbi:uncharacterized protein LOC116207643 [Punica granatum]|uniref:Uncharacterized protein LOC116207643 n=1 Tax=Punica granatum TaxID=22663 RepID=A0A218XT33_PUNGR|nr:uncharacterized protein LOC116207643 [Punica granatum]OWM87816.1 hypothetical protein CDL15_Pgr019400 [Punica granatum]
MGNEMGNNNTTGLREEENSILPEPPGKSSPGSSCEDDKIVENQLISMGKADDLHGEIKSQGNTDVSEKKSERREQPEAPPPEAVKLGVGETEEGGNETTLLTENSGNDGSLLGDDVRVETDHQFESEDLSTKDDPKLETPVDCKGDPKEPTITLERVNDICRESNLMENGNMQESGYSSNATADFAAEAILQSSKGAEEMDLESNEILHQEGNQMENVTVSLTLEFPNGKGGILEEIKESGYSSNVITGFAPEAILESSQSTEEMDQENNEVLHSEGNLMENATVSLASELPDGKEGISKEMKESGYLSNMIGDFALEGNLESPKRTKEMDLANNEVLHLQDNQAENVSVSRTSRFPDDGGISKEIKVTESESIGKLHEEEGDTDGQKGLIDEVKAALGSDESNHQPQCDEVLCLDCANNDGNTSTDIRLFHCVNHKQCQVEADIVAENGFRVDASSEASGAVILDSDCEEDESTERFILLAKQGAVEAPYLVGVEGKEIAEPFVPCPEAKQYDDEESQSSATSNSTDLKSEASVSDFEFEKPRIDLAECPGTSLGFIIETKALENGDGSQSTIIQLSGILNGEQEAEEAKERLSSVSDSGSMNGDIFPKMHKSPSFGLDVQPESDQTPLLFQDKAEISIPTPQEKAATVERSDSEMSKAPFLRSMSREENEEQEPGIAATPLKQDNHRGKEKVITRGKARRKLRSSLFGKCMCCGTVIN